MWLVLALLTAVFWALGSVLLKSAYKQLATSQVFFVNGVAFGAIWALFKLVTATPLVIPEGVVIVLPVIAPLGFLFFSFALKRGKVSIVTAVGSLSIIVSSFLAVFFLHEKLSLIQFWLILLMVVLLAWLGSIERKDNRGSKFAGFVLGGLAALIFGIGSFASKIVINETNAVSYSLVSAGWMSAIGFIWLVKAKKIRLKTWQGVKTKEGKWGTLGNLIFAIGGFFAYLALENGPVCLVVPLTKISVPLAVVFASLFLKEKISPLQKLLIIGIFVSAVGLSLI